ncbi:MAG: monofunctional biosynthetic peptidoglycan transglycosylase [Burkholderiales bacterium]|nr:monofunctional biosynthetic peptidoglycan transglycosylase [Burkholderiales bacterium]
MARSARRVSVRGFWRCRTSVPVWTLRAALLITAIILAYQLWILFHIFWWVEHNPSSSAFMEARLNALQDRKPAAELAQQWVPYERISIHLKRALIAAEDARFSDHEGFDWDGIQHAIDTNLRRGRLAAGGSTISQQLAKNLFLSSQRTPWRKAQEAIITLMLEKIMSKRRIFEIYLNVIEWGDGVFGAQAAARHYFAVSAAQLSRQQAARLAAMAPNPRFYDNHRGSRHLARKTAIILQRMEAAELP